MKNRSITKRKIAVLVLAVILSVAAICSVIHGITYVSYPYDRIADSGVPSQYFCDSEKNRIDYQTDGNCAAYATAYVLRSLGKQTDGESIAAEMKRVFGFVSAKSIVRVLENHGFSAKAYRGNADTLKRRLCGGVPVIVFLSIPRDTHYAVVVGYDAQHFYLVDSLPENANASGRYNRKLTVEEFEKIWKTDTIVSDNTYIVVCKDD